MDTLFCQSAFSSSLIALSFPSLYFQQNMDLLEEKKGQNWSYVSTEKGPLEISNLVFNAHRENNCKSEFCEWPSFFFFFIKNLEVWHRNLDLCDE